MARLVSISDFTAILTHDGSNVAEKDQIIVNSGENISVMDCLGTPEDGIIGKYDSIKRNTLRHDGEKVAQWIKKFFD